MTTVEAVRGMRDLMPPEQERKLVIQAKCLALLAQNGYAPLDLPLLEYRDLYLRKLGEELVGKVYEFTFEGRNLALRPEWTASVLRAYVAQLQDQPLPLRLSYCGPVFRYERPQRSTYRQFTQLGVELIGGPAPRADAEVISLACAGLEAMGVKDYSLTVGHLGLMRQIIAQAGLTERTRGLLVRSLERMRTQKVRMGDLLQAQMQMDPSELPFEPDLLRGLDDAQATTMLLRLAQEIGVNLSYGTRSPEAIVDRLLRKLRATDQTVALTKAAELLTELSQIQGLPREALPQVTTLLQDLGVETPALREFEALLDLLTAHGVSEERIVVDFGLARGLHYYTGMIFEIYDSHAMQLCGGGRYDDLITALGGRKATPAVGFAYGLERVLAAGAGEEETAGRSKEVAVAAVTEADYPYAVEVAKWLRGEGFRVTCDVRGRNVAGNIRDAVKRDIPYLVVIGEAEVANRTLVWRNLATREEQSLGFHDVVALATVSKLQSETALKDNH